MKAYLILADGQVWEGEAFGAGNDAACELVFNTSMSGYVEVITDPSYAGQGLVMTYPLIGNYGMAAADCEASKPWVSALIVRELSRKASNFRNDTSLEAYLSYHGVPGIAGLDTRAITRKLRLNGTMNAYITRNAELTQGEGLAQILEKLKENLTKDVVSLVSEETVLYPDGDGPKIALLHYGAKKSIAAKLGRRGARIKYYRHDAPFERIMEDKPDGVLLSNGPGDPTDCVEAIKTAKALYDYEIPMMAICLGHQILALANGAKTRKMRWGHRGVNHPVKDLRTGRIAITAQNHGYVVEDLPENAGISHVNVNDGSIEGILYKEKKIISVQYHPEAAGGPLDSEYLFDDFLRMIENA